MTARLTGSTTTPTPQTPNTEKTIWNTLYAEIGNAFGVAGLMGNLYAESALNPQNLQNNGNSKLGMTDAEFTKAVDSGKYAADTFIHDGYGYGLAQWTYYSRKQALLNYAKTAGKSIGDLSMQLGFLLKEIKSCKQVWNTLVNAATVREASDAVLLQFERLPIRAIRFELVEQLTVRSIMKSIRMVRPQFCPHRQPYPNDEKRVVLVRHLIAETSRMAVQEGYKQNIIIILPEHLGDGIILHHKYTIWDEGMLLPEGRIIPEGTYIVTYSCGSKHAAERWAEHYYESIGKEWNKYCWRRWY